MKVKVFRYWPELDAFTVTPKYREIAKRLGLIEWTPVVWIGRLFRLDNDTGEHWLDQSDERAKRASLAASHGVDENDLMIVVPEWFQDGSDGPCHPPEIRGRFWRDVLESLELSYELLFAEARLVQKRLREGWRGDRIEDEEDHIPDLEGRIAELSGESESESE